MCIGREGLDGRYPGELEPKPTLTTKHTKTIDLLVHLCVLVSLWLNPSSLHKNADGKSLNLRLTEHHCAQVGLGLADLRLIHAKLRVEG